MASRAILISNNPDFLDLPPAKAEMRFVDGCALDVFIKARDLAHMGWILANHPLYGNYRPHQQPYRSLVMLSPKSEKADFQNDRRACEALGFLEKALALYQGPARKCSPEEVPGHMLRDCALIDRELIGATLESLS